MNTPQDIEAYLDALAERLILPPGRLRRVLAETEDHLRSAATSFAAEGVEPLEAERRAIDRFGSPDVIAKSFAGGPIAWAALLFAAAQSLYGVAVVGLLAIGVSGVLALGLGAAFGKSFVAGDAPGVTYTPERCAEYLRLYPHALDCKDAALADHFGEVVDYRVAAGVLGIVALGGVLLLNRRRPRSSLPDWFAPMTGASVFGVAALALLFMSAPSQGQTGGMLSGAIVAAAVASAYGLRLARYLTPVVRSG